jgi:glycosyltransferase involved in cell wall biosynthesis
MARILIITPKQPSSNPRMRKSADALADAGHEVHVLYAFNAIWADSADEPILNDAKWTYQRNGGHPADNKWRYFLDRLIRRGFEILGCPERALCRGYGSFIRSGIAWQPDLVIGHNPGALAPIVHIGRKLGIPSVFDAEDFHRAESYWVRVQQERKIIDLENRYLPSVTSMTTAAPLISEAYIELYPDIPITTVNNAFSARHCSDKPRSHDGPLKVTWFSQNLGLDRGLQEFLDGMAQAPHIPVELNLLGNSTPEQKTIFESHIQSEHHQIHFHEPRSERELFRFLAKQEVGLALERSVAFNREICRTNKLYSYPLAGCYILASLTKSQQQFLEEHPGIGELVDLDAPSTIAKAIEKLHSNRNALFRARQHCWKQGRDFLNWDVESANLIAAVENAMLYHKSEMAQ